MSLENPLTIDATTVRDGWAVLSIYQFTDWRDLEEPEEALRQKLQTYFEAMQSPLWLQAHHRIPAVIELVSLDPVPASIAALCARYGILLKAGDD